MIKRAFDITASLGGLVVLSPLLALVASAIKVSSPGPVFFCQERVGRGFTPFRIMKFRTMVPEAPRLGGQLTVGGDSRITGVGRFLRKTKLDELPQLVNVFKGDMSFVGPRPEVPKYVELYRADYAELLKVRPGITDLASLKYRDEAEILSREPDPEHAYATKILPDKIALGKEYVRRSSLRFDLELIVRTILRRERGDGRRLPAGQPAG